MGPSEVQVSLDAVIVAVTDETPRVLVGATTRRGRRPGHGPQRPLRLPSGLLEPADRTLERALRRFVRQQAGLEVGYVEQLYTFGDLDRSRGGPPSGRLTATATAPLSMAYLALVRESRPSAGAAWTRLVRPLPLGGPALRAAGVLADEVGAGGGRLGRCRPRRRRAGLRARSGPRSSSAWAAPAGTGAGAGALRAALRAGPAGRVARRAGRRAGATVGRPMQLDHRRVVATALGRLRGKLTYRPVVFELLPPTFTLFQLQRLVEALSGVRLHKQNFRRLVEGGGLVEGTGQLAPTGGRPAELFRFRREVLRERPRPGVGTPWTHS